VQPRRLDLTIAILVPASRASRGLEAAAGASVRHGSLLPKDHSRWHSLLFGWVRSEGGFKGVQSAPERRSVWQ